MKSKLLNYLTLLISIIVFIFSSITICDFMFHASEYRFGSEVAGWRYLSACHYLSLAIMEFGISFLLISMSFFTITKKKIIFQVMLLALIVSTSLLL